MSLQLNSPPAAEPVTLDQAKAWLRVESGDEDALIAALIPAARARAEWHTGRAFITQSWTLWLDLAGSCIAIPLPPFFRRRLPARKSAWRRQRPATSARGGSLCVAITGTTTITGFGNGANLLRLVRFAGALTLTHNAASLILLGGASRVTAAGDSAIYTSDGSGNWRERAYTAVAGAVCPASRWIGAVAISRA